MINNLQKWFVKMIQPIKTFKIALIHTSFVMRKLLPYYIHSTCKDLNDRYNDAYNFLICEIDSFRNIYQCTEHLNKFSSIDYNLFIVALDLPVINGIDFFDKIKSQYMLKNTKNILLLPHRFDLTQIPLNYSGYYLLEPIEQKQFVSMIKQLMCNHFLVKNTDASLIEHKKAFTLI